MYFTYAAMIIVLHLAVLVVFKNAYRNGERYLVILASLGVVLVFGTSKRRLDILFSHATPEVPTTEPA